MDGGGKFESYPRRADGKTEYRPPLSKIINPQQVGKEMESTPDHTKGWIIGTLLSKFIESCPELDPVYKAKLKRLLWLYGLVIFPNLSAEEQASKNKLDPTGAKFEVTPEQIKDIQEIWSTFNLHVPKRVQIEGLRNEDVSLIFPKEPQK